jgi:hypothetical protein
MPGSLVSLSLYLKLLLLSPGRQDHVGVRTTSGFQVKPGRKLCGHQPKGDLEVKRPGWRGEKQERIEGLVPGWVWGRGKERGR